MMILMNAPLWVWPLLVALIGVGVLQMRTRQVSRTRLLVVPFVLLVVSAFSIHGSFQGHVMVLIAWLCGVLLALGLNLLIVKSPGEARYHHEEQVFSVPGSIMPLILILIIFSTRFVVGTTKVMAPALATSFIFEESVGLILGLASGLLLSRALVVLRAAPRVAAP